MIVCTKPMTIRGVRYGPPGRPAFFQAQLAEVEGRIAALDADWAERLQVAEIKSILTNRVIDGDQDRKNYESQRDDLLSVCERLKAQIAEEEQPVLQVMPKAVWDTIPKHKQRNMLTGRFVQQREGRKLQEA